MLDISGCRTSLAFFIVHQYCDFVINIKNGSSYKYVVKTRESMFMTISEVVENCFLTNPQPILLDYLYEIQVSN